MIIFDLDQTLINTDIAYNLRKQGKWGEVYSLIPQMTKYPCIDEIYQRLIDKGIKMALVSSSPKTYCTRVLNHFGLSFDVIVAYHDTSNHKPHPQPYLKAMEVMNFNNGIVYALGDDSNDVLAAKNAGIKSIGCGWGTYNKAALKGADPHLYFDNPCDLFNYFKKIFN
jgi:HAD superfamily hydrolase (TIGR01509 family)